MFGQSHWFQSRGGRLAVLRPRTWKGLLYLAGWGAVVVLPFLMLTARHLTPEAILWVVAAVLALRWDIRGLRRQSDEPLDVREIFVIDERGARLERLKS